MKTIWKYILLKVDDIVTLEMPGGAQVLDVQTQHGKPVMWALVDSQREPVYRKFAIYGTGHPVSHDHEDYVGTFQVHDGHLVFHVFEVRR